MSENKLVTLFISSLLVSTVTTMSSSSAIFLLVLSIASCVINSSEDVVSGIYGATERKCGDPSEIRKVCNDIVLVELVKGKFYNVADDEMAFVVWSGEKSLAYVAREIINPGHIDSYPFKILIEKSDDYAEVFELYSKTEGVYRFGRNESTSVINVRKLTENEINSYPIVYPDRE